MIIWTLTTGEPFLATSLFNSQREAYVELAQQMFGEDSGCPDGDQLDQLLHLLDTKDRLVKPERLTRATIEAFDDELGRLGMTVSVEMHSHPVRMRKSSNSSTQDARVLHLVAAPMPN